MRKTSEINNDLKWKDILDRDEAIQKLAEALRNLIDINKCMIDEEELEATLGEDFTDAEKALEQIKPYL